MEMKKSATEIKEGDKMIALVDIRKAPPCVTLSASQTGCRPFTLAHETQWKLLELL